MLAERDLHVSSFRHWGRVRMLLFYLLFAALSWAISDAVLSRGQTTTVLLLLGFVAAGLGAFIFWRPVIGLYAAVLLPMALDAPVPGDPISKYTGYFGLDLNTTVHAGIAFSPFELMVILTTLAYIIRALHTGTRLRGGSLGPPVFIFGCFLVTGFFWGLAHQSDPKIGLFEVRGLFMIVLSYFLATNLAIESRHVERLLGLIVGGIGVLAVWGAFRFFIFFHGKSGGPDSAFGTVHDDAMLLGFLIVICLLRLVFGGSRRQKIVLLLLLAPAALVLLEMQRRAAFFTLYFAVVIMAIALFSLRRRLFFQLVPLATVFMLVYAAAFWNSSSMLAQPIRAWKSQTSSSSLSSGDTRDYESNQYRVNEKLDVRDTILSSPIMGIGFGRPFLDTHPLVVLPWWPFQFYTPHIEVFWVWLKVGAFGFIAFWVMLCTGLMRAGHVIRREGAGPLGLSCLMAAVFVVMLITFSYVDVGLFGGREDSIMGVMLSVIATSTRLSAARTRQEAEPTRVLPSWSRRAA